MFREIILPIFRSTRLCVTVCGIMHPRCCRPVVCNIYGKFHIVGEAYMIARMLQIVPIINVIFPSLLDKVFWSRFFCIVARFRRIVAGFFSPRTGTDSRPIHLSIVLDKVERESSFSPNTSVLPGQYHSITSASSTLTRQA